MYHSFPHTDWQRIERIVRECRTSVLSLALSLGFKRPDPLYRIKSNERKITLALAVRILRNWPQFNLGWLLTGQGPVRLEVGPASGEGNLSPLSGDAVSPQRKFGAPPTAESIVGRWELTHAFSLVDEWQSDGQPDATFACNEIVWDFGPDRIVVQYEWGVEVAREGYLYDPASGQLFVEHSVMQIVRLNAETLEFLVVHPGIRGVETFSAPDVLPVPRYPYASSAGMCDS